VDFGLNLFKGYALDLQEVHGFRLNYLDRVRRVISFLTISHVLAIPPLRRVYGTSFKRVAYWRITYEHDGLLESAAEAVKSLGDFARETFLGVLELPQASLVEPLNNDKDSFKKYKDAVEEADKNENVFYNISPPYRVAKEILEGANKQLYQNIESRALLAYFAVKFRVAGLVLALAYVAQAALQYTIKNILELGKDVEISLRELLDDILIMAEATLAVLSSHYTLPYYEENNQRVPKLSVLAGSWELPCCLVTLTAPRDDANTCKSTLANLIVELAENHMLGTYCTQEDESPYCIWREYVRKSGPEEFSKAGPITVNPPFYLTHPVLTLIESDGMPNAFTIDLMKKLLEGFGAGLEQLKILLDQLSKGVPDLPIRYARTLISLLDYTVSLGRFASGYAALLTTEENALKAMNTIASTYYRSLAKKLKDLTSTIEEKWRELCKTIQCDCKHCNDNKIYCKAANIPQDTLKLLETLRKALCNIKGVAERFSELYELLARTFSENTPDVPFETFDDTLAIELIKKYYKDNLGKTVVIDEIDVWEIARKACEKVCENKRRKACEPEELHACVETKVHDLLTTISYYSKPKWENGKIVAQMGIKDLLNSEIRKKLEGLQVDLYTPMVGIVRNYYWSPKKPWPVRIKEYVASPYGTITHVEELREIASHYISAPEETLTQIKMIPQNIHIYVVITYNKRLENITTSKIIELIKEYIIKFIM